MKKIATLMLLLLLALPLAAQGQTPQAPSTEPDDAPVKVVVKGLSKDRTGINYRVTVLTHKPIRFIDLGVTAYSNEGYIGSMSLRWPPTSGRGVLAMGRTYDCVQRVVKRPLQSGDRLTVERGVLQVTFTDGTTWTSAGAYSGTGR